MYHKDSKYFVNKKFFIKNFFNEKLSPEHPDPHHLYYIGGIGRPRLRPEPLPYDAARAGYKFGIISDQRAVHVKRLVRLREPRAFPVYQHLRDVVVGDVHVLFVDDLARRVPVFRVVAGPAAMDVVYPSRAEPRGERVKEKLVHVMEPVRHLAGELPLDNHERAPVPNRVWDMRVTVFDVVNQYVDLCSHIHHAFNNANIGVMFDI